MGTLMTLLRTQNERKSEQAAYARCLLPPCIRSHLHPDGLQSAPAVQALGSASRERSFHRARMKLCKHPALVGGQDPDQAVRALPAQAHRRISV